MSINADKEFSEKAAVQFVAKAICLVPIGFLLIVGLFTGLLNDLPIIGSVLAWIRIAAGYAAQVLWAMAELIFDFGQILDGAFAMAIVVLAIKRLVSKPGIVAWLCDIICACLACACFYISLNLIAPPYMIFGDVKAALRNEAFYVMNTAFLGSAALVCVVTYIVTKPHDSIDRASGALCNLILFCIFIPFVLYGSSFTWDYWRPIKDNPEMVHALSAVDPAEDGFSSGLEAAGLLAQSSGDVGEEISRKDLDIRLWLYSLVKDRPQTTLVTGLGAAYLNESLDMALVCDTKDGALKTVELYRHPGENSTKQWSNISYRRAVVERFLMMHACAVLKHDELALKS